MHVTVRWTKKINRCKRRHQVTLSSPISERSDHASKQTNKQTNKLGPQSRHFYSIMRLFHCKMSEVTDFTCWFCKCCILIGWFVIAVQCTTINCIKNWNKNQNCVLIYSFYLNMLKLNNYDVMCKLKNLPTNNFSLLFVFKDGTTFTCSPVHPFTCSPVHLWTFPSVFIVQQWHLVAVSGNYSNISEPASSSSSSSSFNVTINLIWDSFSRFNIRGWKGC